MNRTFPSIKYPKLVYVAGRFRSSHAGDQFEQTMNILAAMQIALDVWKMGAVALCPHGNTFCFQGTMDDSVWLEGSLLLLERCDAVMCVPNWTRSEGAKLEIKYAEELGKPVFYSFTELGKWLRDE